MSTGDGANEATSNTAQPQHRHSVYSQRCSILHHSADERENRRP